ncbi:MAG TPA: 3-oxoacyl-ACP synthase [Herpetosiphonaceae bacterium]|nr:3-oxoacyl-ACP synthase [Herpetosiphonaceae bacterium]
MTHESLFPPIGIAAIGVHLPQPVETAAAIAAAAGIPAEVVERKLGIRQKHLAGPDDTPSAMAAAAARHALDQAGLDPAELDLIIYHGSEYKDYVVWSAAAKIQHMLGATRAYAYEIYALCAGAPVAIKTARDQMRADPSMRNVLLVAAARENELVDYRNERARFMFNFGAGASALLLRRGLARNEVLESAVLVDGSFSENVVMRGGGARHPASADTVAGGLHQLDVLQLEDMRDRLGAVSLPNFVTVIDQAVARSGHSRAEIAFLALTHMKPSFHQGLLRELGLRDDQAIYLDEFGHIQSVDQQLALFLAQQRGRIKDGDLVVLAGAGTGYTWAATAVRWGRP